MPLQRPDPQDCQGACVRLYTDEGRGSSLPSLNATLGGAERSHVAQMDFPPGLLKRPVSVCTSLQRSPVSTVSNSDCRRGKHTRV